MSDSAKLRFVYGLIGYILSFLALAAIVVLSFLIVFNIIPSECVFFIVLLAIVIMLSFMTAIDNFKKLYYIGKDEK